MPPRKTRNTTNLTTKQRAKKRPNNFVSAVAVKKTSKSFTVAFVSQLLSASPIDFVEATGSHGDSDGNRTAAATGASPELLPHCSALFNPTRRLATILHGVFLVTMTTKAQLGISVGREHITAKTDERWFEALVRYCGFTVVVWDIIECAVAFSDWLKVFTVMKPPVVANEQDKHFADSGGTSVVLKVDELPQVVMLTKIKLLCSTVPSIAQAEAFLEKRWGHSDEWRKNHVLHSATAGETTERPLTSAPAQSMPAAPPAAADNIHDVDGGGGNVSDEELLGQISEELRASLSETRLRALVTQMRREALGVDAREQELVNRRQRLEKILSTYDLLRVILGKKRSVCNVTRLVQQMVEQNRFGDSRECVLQQLEALAQYPESGITIFSFVTEPREDYDVGSGILSLSTVATGATLSSYSTRLETMFLSLNSHIASKKALHAAIQRD